MNQIGFKIKKLREFRGYTQSYIAGSIGISQPAYANIENMRTPITLIRLEEIAVVLNVDAIELLSIELDKMMRVT